MTDQFATIAESLRAVAARLAGISETARLDAEILMAHAIGISRGEMLMRQHDLAVPENFAGLIERRGSAEPVAYIRGCQEFWGMELTVTPDVLIPRSDSETLIEMAVDAFADGAGPRHILDLGTGSGALLLAALSEFPVAIGIGIDASAAAVAVAGHNAAKLGFRNRAVIRHLSWRDADWAKGLGQFDLVLCNPPYVEASAVLDATVTDHEPHSALFAGADGLDDYRILIPQVCLLLRPGGTAIFEIGHLQEKSVSELARDVGLSTEMRRDLANHPRALRFLLGID